MATWPPGHLATWPPGHLAAWPLGHRRHLAKEVARRDRRDSALLDIDDSHIKQQLAEMPSVAAEFGDDTRAQRLRDARSQLPI